jgi:hypothetical protein
MFTRQKLVRLLFEPRVGMPALLHIAMQAMAKMIAPINNP